MRVLLDTNILIHREASKIARTDIGVLFNWLDRLGYQKYMHPLSLDEIKRHKDADVVKTIEAKVQTYNLLKTEAPEVEEIIKIRKKYDRNDNDSVDTSLLKEIYHNRIDFLITEDRKIHRKANELGISSRIFTIDAFLEKVTAENPELSDYKVLSVKKEYFGNIDINDPFFESFKEDYIGFESWFNRKSDEIAYICQSETNNILAFLYLKIEEKNENYKDIQPPFPAKRRLKIGTFKVVLNGFKLGERFLKIVFDNALAYRAEEIYVTVFNKTSEQQRLILLLEDWGFVHYGNKATQSGEELVFVRDFSSRIDANNPRFTYPYFSIKPRKFIVPIYPQYHTELFPDSILRTESPTDFVENKPNRNAIRKVYISRSFEKNLSTGDIIVFYRTKSGGSAHYTSVATTIGIVEKVITDISNLEQFIYLCRKRSVFTNNELAEYWNYNPRNRPFIVDFLYVHSFPKRPNLKSLIENGIIAEPPRGFERLTDESFDRLLIEANANLRIIVN
jgi:predicted nucleic acid-binding protein